MTLPNRFWMPENPDDKPYVTTGPLAAPPYVKCVRVDSLDGWRDIYDDPPKLDGKLIIVLDDHWDTPVFSVYATRETLDGFGLYSASLDPTHWMPLPEPPT